MYNLVKSILLSAMMISSGLLLAQSKAKYTYSEGSTFIYEAEIALNKGNVTKAEKLIDKAKQADYGFCGNAWFDAFARIHIIEINILLAQQKYEASLTYMDSLIINQKTDQVNKIDSMKIVVLIREHGKEKVVKAFSEATNFRSTDVNGIEFYIIALDDLAYQFCFQKSNEYAFATSKPIGTETISKEECWKVLKTKSFYPLIG